jgi:HK97 family phage portal protein
MSIFSKLFRSKKPGPEDDYWYMPFNSPTASGIRVSEKEALSYLTVYSCVSLIAGDLGRLPLNLYKTRKDGGKDIITDHYLYDLLHNMPNEEMTSFSWREAAQGHLLLWGNHYSKIERDKQGKIAALWPLANPGAVKVRRVGANIIYEYKVDNEDVRRSRKEIFHIPGYGFNGLTGMSMISMAREAIGLGLAAETFGSRYFGEGTHPSGILSIPPELKLGDKLEEYKKGLKEQYSRLGNSQGIMLLQNGEEYKPMTVPLEDAQFLQTRNYQKTEICGMYHVPPHKIAIHGQNSNYNNLEQENSSYVDSCLMHWVARWEATISQQLLTREERLAGYYFKFVVQGLLRGNAADRSNFYAKMSQIGSMTPNEVRAKEDLNPIKGGDTPFIMLNMIPLDMARDAAKVQTDKADDANEEPKEEEPKEEDDKDLEKSKAFFSKTVEKRSILGRDRVIKRFYPLFLKAAERIVNYESKAITKKVKKETSNRANGDMVTWLDDFYKGLPEIIKREIGPVFTSFANTIIDLTADELNMDNIPELEQFITDYIDTYAKRHIGSSLGQLQHLLQLEADLSALETRVDEWTEKRPAKIVNNETVRGSNAVYQVVAFAGGYATVWRIRGAKTCPYCTELNGQRVRAVGESFVKAGDELNPDGGDGPMKIYGMKAHPPLHQGCDCYLSIA